MTPSPPPEALHFRGKTLTPESPRPLHIPEPSNIPVLQNQMDPTFNDTATYERPQPSDPAPRHHSDAAATPQDPSIRPPAYENTGLEAQPNLSAPNGSSYNDPGSHPMSLDLPTQGTDGQNDTPSTTLNVFPNPSHDYNPSSALGDTVSLPSDHSSLLSRLITSDNAPQDSQHAALLSTAVAPQGRSPGQAEPHNIDFAGDHAHSHASKAEDDVMRDTDAVNGVNYQALLENLSPSAAAAPTAASPAEASSISQSVASEKSLPFPAGLPPRPPPQEKPSIHPNYSPTDNIRSFHQLPSQNTNNGSNTTYQNSQTGYRPNTSLPPIVPTVGAPGTLAAPNGLPPPPIATFQQSHSGSAGQDQQEQRSKTVAEASQQQQGPHGEDSDEAPWGPDVQKKYDEFLANERVYVTEGLWDRFPAGSRLFVGNLPTERVTKRDLFHLFHRHGKLAQISIKQAYGFVQFLEAVSCQRALQAEQGGIIRGRKIHLEISKPQKPSRPGVTAESSRGVAPRRSRSPEHRSRPANSPRTGNPRHDRAFASDRVPFSDFRDEPSRRRDDYRPPVRSPSPRGFRGRDEYRSRNWSPERYDRRDRRRSRSPQFGRNGRRRSPSPRGRNYGNDADLPIPRRAAREVPDVQVIVLDEVDTNFVYHIEKTLRDRGLRSEVLMLNPRIQIDAVIRRQILEGVIAIIKLTRAHQYSGKIPLQVFDRSGGADNVRFNEYAELDVNIAAEVVKHSMRSRQTVNPTPTPTANPSSTYLSQFVPPQQPTGIQAAPGPANVANLISTLDGASLQKLLGVLQQPQQQIAQGGKPPQFPAAVQGQAPLGPGGPDLTTLLNSVMRQPGQQGSYPQTNPQATVNNPFPIPQANANAASGNNGFVPAAGSLPTLPSQGGADVQNIMAQLSRWKS